MIKLVCPNCMGSVPVPDDFTGPLITCPACEKSFEAPPRYTPAVLAEPVPPPPAPSPASASPAANPSPASEKIPVSSAYDPPAGPPTPPPGYVPPTLPPPGSVPPAPPGYVPPAAPADIPPLPTGYTRERSLIVSPQLLQWLPPILLTLCLVLTFFPWVATHTGGAIVQSQSGWGALFGGVSRNFALEESTGWVTNWIDNLRSDWELLVPYLLALLIAIAFAWADRGLHSLDPRQIPPLARLWPWRTSIIALFAGLAWLLLTIQTLNGFGLQRALQRSIIAQFEQQRAAATSQAERAKIENRQRQEFERYDVERTTWLYLSLVCNLLAALAVLGRMGLEARGTKPPPRFVIQY